MADGVAQLPVLTPSLVHLLGGPMDGGPTLAALGEPHIPLLRHWGYAPLFKTKLLMDMLCLSTLIACVVHARVCLGVMISLVSLCSWFQ